MTQSILEDEYHQMYKIDMVTGKCSVERGCLLLIWYMYDIETLVLRCDECIEEYIEHGLFF